jgi:hypothetical protein
MPAFDPAAATRRSLPPLEPQQLTAQLKDQPGAQVRRRAFITGQVSSRQAVIAASRSAARRGWQLHAPADPVQQQIQPGRGAVHPGTGGAPAQRSSLASSPDLPIPAPPGRPPGVLPSPAAGLQTACTGHHRLYWAPPAPLEASTARPGSQRPLAAGSPASETPGTAALRPSHLGRVLRIVSGSSGT